MTKVVRHYTYRVHTSGGHIHNVLVPYATMSEFWVCILELSSKGACLETQLQAPNGVFYEITMLASAITVVDAPVGRAGIDITEIKGLLKVERTKNATKKAEKKKREAIMQNNRNSARKRTL